MSNKIKIALCLSGEPRSTMASFPYIYESFLQPNPDFEVDVYIHTWKGFRALNLYNPKKYHIENNINLEKYFVNFLNSLNYNSKEIQQLTFPFKHITHNAHPLKNVFLMFSSMEKCFNLIEEKYDFYIRGRLDLFFEHKINLINILNLFYFNNKIEMCFNTHTFHTASRKLLNDQLFFSNHKGFKAFNNIISNLESLIIETNSFYPEILLETHLKNNNIQIGMFNILEQKLIRSCNLITNSHNFKDE